MAAEMVIHIADCENVIIVEENIGTDIDDSQDVVIVEEKMGTDIDDSQDIIIVKEQMGTVIHDSQDVILVEEKMCNPLNWFLKRKTCSIWKENHKTFIGASSNQSVQLAIRNKYKPDMYEDCTCDEIVFRDPPEKGIELKDFYQERGRIFYGANLTTFKRSRRARRAKRRHL